MMGNIIFGTAVKDSEPQDDNPQCKLCSQFDAGTCRKYNMKTLPGQTCRSWEKKDADHSTKRP